MLGTYTARKAAYHIERIIYLPDEPGNHSARKTDCEYNQGKGLYFCQNLPSLLQLRRQDYL